jgi:transposase-like protein
MKRSTRITPLRRAKFLAAFERSGLSAAAFARQQGLNYTTFCGWRQRGTKAKASPEFVQVELASVPAPAELVIELSANARLRLTSASQLDLAAALLQRLAPTQPC